MASATVIIESVPVQSSLQLVKKRSRESRNSPLVISASCTRTCRKSTSGLGRTAFQNLQEQNEELARDLAEREADLEELANLVSTKDEVIKNGERRLLQAKKVIADLKAEVQSLRSRDDHEEPDNQHQPPQQQSETEIGRVSSHSLSGIHSRYDKVLQVIYDNRCSMANAFRLAGCPRSTVRDFVAIAELKIVDHREHERVIRDHVGSVKELEVTCRKRLRRYLPVMANLRREGKREDPLLCLS